jgi:hypothetical protein
MKTSLLFGLGLCGWLAVLAPAHASLTGDYLEVRSCDVYTGSCVANSEMGLTGKEGLLVWTVREGAWEGVSLKGLSVIAAVRADGTLGDLRSDPRRGAAVLIVDERGTASQRAALVSFVRSVAGSLIREVAEVKALPIESSIGACSKSGCAGVTAGTEIEINTRCLGGKDHLCGNEELYYPPLTEVSGAVAAYAELAAFRGQGLNTRWETVGKRSVYIAQFAR